MKSVSKNKRLLLFVGILLAVGAVGVVAWYALSKQSTKPANYTYYCIADWGGDKARCLKRDDTSKMGGCFGYFDKRGASLRDGIDVPELVSATCEGFMNPRLVYFDAKGNYLGED